MSKMPKKKKIRPGQVWSIAGGMICYTLHQVSPGTEYEDWNVLILDRGPITSDHVTDIVWIFRVDKLLIDV